MAFMLKKPLLARTTQLTKPSNVEIRIFVSSSVGFVRPNIHETDFLLCALCIGKGLHSQGGHAKIKPAIEELMQK